MGTAQHRALNTAHHSTAQHSAGRRHGWMMGDIINRSLEIKVRAPARTRGVQVHTHPCRYRRSRDRYRHSPGRYSRGRCTLCTCGYTGQRADLQHTPWSGLVLVSASQPGPTTSVLYNKGNECMLAAFPIGLPILPRPGPSRVNRAAVLTQRKHACMQYPVHTGRIWCQRPCKTCSSRCTHTTAGLELYPSCWCTDTPYGYIPGVSVT
jgi:hypothetical protein